MTSNSTEIVQNHAADSEGWSGEQFDSSKIEALERGFSDLATENFQLHEALQNIEMMIDSRGWSPIFDGKNSSGMSLTQVKEAAKQLRELLAGNPFIARASEVRNIYIHAGGVDIAAESAAGKHSKLTASVQKLVDSASWQRYILESDAREELERCAATDGNVLVLGDDLTKRVQRLDINQITAELRNPENPEEIWAYRREWTPDPINAPETQMVRWYYADIFEDTRPSSITVNTKSERVDRSKTIIDVQFNAQVGWPFGVPDFLDILSYARLYKEFLVNGYIMSKALAQFAYKVTVDSQKQAAASAIAIAKPGGQAGETHIGPNDLTPMTTAGKGYDFKSGEPILGAIAAGTGVTISEINGSAQAEFTATGRGMAALRRNTWDSFFRRLLKWAGESKKVKITWHDLSDAQIQRRLQAITLANNTGYFKPEIIQKHVAEVLEWAEFGELPATAAAPTNNSAAGGTKDDPGVTGASGSTGGSGQGADNGGAGSLGNDHTTDGE